MFRRLFGKGQDAPRTEEEAQEEEQKIDQATEKTRRGFFGQIAELFSTGEPITDELWDDLEALLIQGDVGIETTQYLVNRTIDRCNRNGVKRADEAREMLIAEMVSVLTENAEPRRINTRPYVLMVVGVNGVGKTTLIAKLAHRYKVQFGKSVMLAAADTFRAAATEQLETWAERAGVPVIARGQGSDAGAVVHDAVGAALEQDVDLLIIDTAGRLHVKANLMRELEKIRNVIRRRIPEGPHEVLLVIDATTGQNGILQGKSFMEAVNVTDVAITKMDGTAKGGIAFAVAQDIEQPIRYIGTGEKITDLAMFDSEAFVDSLFAR
ncbi:MAG: Signal recognition particle GTPase [Chloroflexi bacterium AL-W]|nr:Signal recognition particle GTPase [Chloroflexi bacterium AL-N1]NOK66609.1 Signal recognition particle GTPase [Chloroflexi bacterium AL-N10]NOK71997.1 Signal recognition particle GTPase [Chloroflexi bacterium AL-N5]NOK81254.1 Signal recognition particle GTPase [Chloroflexi bacterium AL-W]NOK89527.1 Signal recognition particle GTPase [Chloroflexi bacterium AL-N15]